MQVIAVAGAYLGKVPLPASEASRLLGRIPVGTCRCFHLLHDTEGPGIPLGRASQSGGRDNVSRPWCLFPVKDLPRQGNGGAFAGVVNVSQSGRGPLPSLA